MDGRIIPTVHGSQGLLGHHGRDIEQFEVIETLTLRECPRVCIVGGLPIQRATAELDISSSTCMIRVHFMYLYDTINENCRTTSHCQAHEDTARPFIPPMPNCKNYTAYNSTRDEESRWPHRPFQEKPCEPVSITSVGLLELHAIVGEVPRAVWPTIAATSTADSSFYLGVALG